MFYTDIPIDWKGWKPGINQRCQNCRAAMPNFIIHGCVEGYAYWQYCEGISILNELVEVPELCMPGDHVLDSMLDDLERHYLFEKRFRIRKYRQDELGLYAKLCRTR